MTERVEDFIEVRRHAERGSYERSVIDAVLTKPFFCTVEFVDDGRPVVIPTIHVRVGDMVVLHGSSMLRTLKTGEPCAIGVTIFDGLVFGEVGAQPFDELPQRRAPGLRGKRTG